MAQLYTINPKQTPYKWGLKAIFKKIITRQYLLILLVSNNPLQFYSQDQEQEFYLNTL